MNEKRLIRVALFDDHKHTHKIVTLQLSSAIDIQLVAQGRDGREALKICEQSDPDVVLMDILMSDMSGVEATRLLHQRFPKIKILAFSNYYDHENIFEMLKNGAVGYITKGSSNIDLVETIRTTFLGKMVFSPDVGNQLKPLTPHPYPNIYNLTERELEIIKLLADGISLRIVSEMLSISRSTVKFHVRNICHKMGVQSRYKALILAAKSNLI